MTGANLLRRFGRFYSLPLLVLIWWAAVEGGLVTSRLLPDPLRVATAFWQDTFVRGTLLAQAGVTLMRALSGFVLGALIGVGLALAMARSRLFGRLVEPLLFMGYPVPKIALYPVFIFIFGLGTSSKIAFTVLEVLYPVCIATFFALTSIPVRLIWTARNFGASPFATFRRVILPAMLPQVFAGLRIALPLALTIVVVTEIIGDSAGLGYYINIASTRFRYQNVYAGIVMTGLCGFLLDLAILWLHRRIVYWEKDYGRR